MILNGFQIEQAVRRQAIRHQAVQPRRRLAAAVALATLLATILAPIVEAGGKVFRSHGA